VPIGIDRVRGVVETILEDAPATLLELKRRLAGELSIEPKAEVLQALAALAEIRDPGARAVATRATVLHLLLESTHTEIWERPDPEPAALTVALEAVPSILDLAREEASALATAVAQVDRMQRDGVARIHGALKRPEEPLLAALAVVPELNRLVQASRSGRLEQEAPYLHAQEAEILTASGIDRALLDSVALRSAIERSLAEGAEASRLSDLRTAHTVVSHRLDALRARRFEQTRKSDPQLDAARKRLFATYLGLSKALAGETEPTVDVRESILAAEREGAAIDAERAQTAETIKTATDGTAADAPREVQAPDVRDLLRERRRKKVLTWTFAALVPVTIGVNLWLLPHGKSGALVELQPLNVAMPVSEAMPIGGVLYSQVATFLWDGMDDRERTRRLSDLGKIAGRQGYRSVVVVDDSRTERGYWSATGGVSLRSPSRAAKDPTTP
jgi:hypothetical protein